MGSDAKTRVAYAGLLVAVAGALGGALALASGGGARDDGVLEIAMGDGAIELERTVTAPGRQVVEVVNEGTAEHEVVLVRSELAPGELPVGLHGVSIGRSGTLVIGEDHLKAGHNHPPGVVLGLEPGQSQRFQVDLAAGSYVVFCQTGSHYLGGERVGLTAE
jgi:hypothetical protein